jgi:hypothetical protein
MKTLSTSSTLLVVVIALLLLQSFSGNLLHAEQQNPGLATAKPVAAVQQAPKRTPFWNALHVEDDVPKRLLKVPAGKRFVLTDMWFLSREEQVITSSPSDRLWLESRYSGERYIVFDSPLNELPRPLQWQTGITFPQDSQMWFNYRAANKTNLLRRILITGYFEDLPAAH